MQSLLLSVVDNQPLMLEALVSLLSTPFARVVATGTNAADVIHICWHHRPDVMVVDLGAAGDVYAAIAAGLAKSPKTKIIAYTAARGVEAAIRALDAGAAGYVLKDSDPRE